MTTTLYNEDTHGLGNMRTILAAKGPKDAIKGALEEWWDWIRYCDEPINERTLTAYPNETGTGWREWVVLYHDPREEM